MNYVSIENIKTEKTCEKEVKPFLIFQGEEFEVNENMKRMKNLIIGSYFEILDLLLLIDMFNVHKYQEIDVMQQRRLIVFTYCNDVV